MMLTPDKATEFQKSEIPHYGINNFGLTSF